MNFFNNLFVFNPQEISVLIFCLDIILKSLLILLVSSKLLSMLAGKSTARTKNLVWLVTLAALFSLPVFSQYSLPLISESIEFTVITLLLPDSELVSASLSGVATTYLYNQFFAIYLIGISFFVSKFLLALYQLRRICKSVDPKVCAEEKFLLQSLQGKIGIVKNVSLGSSPLIKAPISFGIFKPQIVLPSAYSSWNKATLESVLAHELGHIKRMDWIISLFNYCLAMLNWFNPLVWYVKKKAEEQAEIACDVFALECGKSKYEYANHLVFITRQINQSNAQIALTQSMIDNSELASRIENVLKPTHRDTANKYRLFAAVLGLTLYSFGIGSSKIIAIESLSNYSEANLVHREQPKYPEFAYNNGIEGRSQLIFDIDENGRVDPNSIRPIYMNSYQEFDVAAKEALKNFRFNPRTVRGEPKAARNFKYTFSFEITNSVYRNP